MNEVALRTIIHKVRGYEEENIYEERPALYFLGEILVLRHCTPEDLREIHEAKLKFPWMRIIQDPI